MVSREEAIMRALLFLAVLLGCSEWYGTANAGAVRISQIYPRGGDQADLNSPYRTDYVELLNSSGAPVDVGGWLLAYGGSNYSSLFGCGTCTATIPVNTVIAPCHYLLIQVGTASEAYGATLPTPDVVLSIPNLGFTGSLGLLTGGIPTGTCLSGPTVEDLVGWEASCYQGAYATRPGSSEALFRLADGMKTTGSNQADFAVAPASPRNSGTKPSLLCLQTPTQETTWGLLKAFYR